MNCAVPAVLVDGPGHGQEVAVEDPPPAVLRLPLEPCMPSMRVAVLPQLDPVVRSATAVYVRQEEPTPAGAVVYLFRLITNR